MHLLPYLITLPVGRREEKQESERGECEELRIKAEVYRRMLLRYAYLIEQAETKSITELKGMVNPEDEAILELREKILEEFRPYIYSEHFPKAAERAVEIVNKIRNIELPLDFWLSPREVILLDAADGMDKAILLCSLLKSLGCESAKVVITEAKEPFVFFECGKEAKLVNVLKGTVRSGSKEEILKMLEQNKPLYAFNEKEYEDYSEK